MSSPLADFIEFVLLVIAATFAIGLAFAVGAGVALCLKAVL